MSQISHLTPHGSYLQAHLLLPSILFSQTSGPQEDFVKNHTEGGLLLSDCRSTTCSKRQKRGEVMEMWIFLGWRSLTISKASAQIKCVHAACKSATYKFDVHITNVHLIDVPSSLQKNLQAHNGEVLFKDNGKTLELNLSKSHHSQPTTFATIARYLGHHSNTLLQRSNTSVAIENGQFVHLY